MRIAVKNHSYDRSFSVAIMVEVCNFKDTMMSALIFQFIPSQHITIQKSNVDDYIS